MLRLLFALLLATPMLAMGQTINCATSSLSDKGTGSPSVVVVELDGAAGAWWCPEAGGRFRAQTLGGLWKDQIALTTTIAPRVMKAVDPVAQLRTELATAGLAPAGSAAECRIKQLTNAACVKLYQADLGPAYPGKFTLVDAQTRCGASPSCVAPPPTTTWKTPASGTMTLYTVVNGLRGPAIIGRTAPTSTECGCNRLQIKLVVAGVTANYCPLMSNTLNNEVTLCRQVTQ